MHNVHVDERARDNMDGCCKIAGVSWCCGNYCLLAFVLWCGYCSVSFQSFVLRHWCPQHQETTKIARMVNTTMPLKLGMKVLESLHSNFQEVIIISSSGVNLTPYGGGGRKLEFKERSLKGLLEGVTVVPP